MSYSTSDGRQQVLDDLAQAVDEIAYALASLGAAYEELDEPTGDRLEEELFGPVQRALGRAKRAHAEFATRAGLPGREFEQPSPGPPSTRAKGFIANAVDAISSANGMLATIQDSDVTMEVGDQELRTALTDLRGVIDPLPSRARELVRGVGR